MGKLLFNFFKSCLQAQSMPINEDFFNKQIALFSNNENESIKKIQQGKKAVRKLQEKKKLNWKIWKVCSKQQQKKGM